MTYAALADAVAVMHALAIATMLVGGFLAWRWRWVLAVHVPVAIAIGVIFLLGADCPLTALEQRLRVASGGPSYDGGFIEHYFVQPITGGGMTPTLRVLVLVLAVTANLLAYGGFVMREVAARRSRPTSTVALS